MLNMDLQQKIMSAAARGAGVRISLRYVIPALAANTGSAAVPAYTITQGRAIIGALVAAYVEDRAGSGVLKDVAEGNTAILSALALNTIVAPDARERAALTMIANTRPNAAASSTTNTEETL